MNTLSDKLAWAEAQPWADSMKECPQDPHWHPEGDVWTHTLMVCDALPSIVGDVSEEDRQALEWAAVLHDVAKPECLTYEDGQIRSHHHCSKGATRARWIMADAGVPFKVRETACGLIRWHMQPINIERAEDTAYHVVFTSWLCRNDLLHLFAQADNIGRSFAGKEESLLWIDMWAERCRELECFRKPYDFYNHKARLEFYEKRSFRPYYEPYVNPGEETEVVFLSGLPGVGKSYFARTVFPDRPLVELDTVRKQMGLGLKDSGKAVQEMKERCRVLLRSKTPFVFAGVNFLKKNRRRWLGLFFAYGARVNIVYLERPLVTTLAMNSDRESVVPEPVVFNMRHRFEIPAWDECHCLTLRYWDETGESQ